MIKKMTEIQQSFKHSAQATADPTAGLVGWILICSSQFITVRAGFSFLIITLLTCFLLFP